jgi:TRAP-type C4-dicarboxylate transport system permease small subunit
MLSEREFDSMTTILRLPVWIAYVPVLMSLVLLAVAAAITIAHCARIVAGREQP